MEMAERHRRSDRPPKSEPVRTPNATGAPQRPPLQKGYVPGCFQECYEDFEFFENVQDVIRAGPPSDSTKMSCDTSDLGQKCVVEVLERKGVLLPFFAGEGQHRKEATAQF